MTVGKRGKNVCGYLSECGCGCVGVGVGWAWVHEERVGERAKRERDTVGKREQKKKVMRLSVKICLSA